MVDHHRTNAQPSVRRQTSQRHDVQPALIFGRVQPTADRPNYDIIVVGQFGHFASLQHIDVEALVVRNREDDCVESLQLFDVVRRNVTEFYAGPVCNCRRRAKSGVMLQQQIMSSRGDQHRHKTQIWRIFLMNFLAHE